MLLALVATIVLAPAYWLLVPKNARRNVLAIMSLVGLGLIDVRLPVALVGMVALLHGATRAMAVASRHRSRWIMVMGLVGLAVLFSLNKTAGTGDMESALPTQGGIALLGASYFVLRAGSILIEVDLRRLAQPGFVRLARWLVFLPVQPSGPIESFRHFDDQMPAVDRGIVLEGLDRILVGCFRALVLSSLLAQWSDPILAEPSSQPSWVLLAATYAATIRIYLDFAGYSDIAIGVSALYGYRIQENFDSPLMQRNLGALWQRWHMTLTGWLRVYLFTPMVRALMSRGRRWDRSAVVLGQLATMLVCGLWHQLTLGFAIWGILHGACLAWLAVAAKPIGRFLPGAWVQWWRTSRTAHAFSVVLTITVFAMINLFAVATPGDALQIASRIISGAG